MIIGDGHDKSAPTREYPCWSLNFIMNVAKTAALVGLGLYEIMAGLLTQTQSPNEQAADLEIVSETLLSINQFQPTAM
jgi:hypothetical protein